LKDNENNELLQRLRLSTPDYTVSTLEKGCYRLRGIDEQQLQGIATQQTLCIAQALAVPTLQAKDLVDDGRFASSLSWPIVKGATQYRVQIASDATFNTVLENRLV
jgi:hypothetical protein